MEEAALGVPKAELVNWSPVLLLVAVLGGLGSRAGGTSLQYAVGAGVTVAIAVGIVLFRVGLVGSLMYFFTTSWLLPPPLQEA